MKTIREKTTPTGRRLVTVELADGEKLLAIQEQSHYRLGQPFDEVVGGHIVADMRRVTWCSAQQEWVE